MNLDSLIAEARLLTKTKALSYHYLGFVTLAVSLCSTLRNWSVLIDSDQTNTNCRQV